MVINHVSFIIDDIGTPTMIPINSKIHNFQSANMLCLNVMIQESCVIGISNFSLSWNSYPEIHYRDTSHEKF